MQCWDLFLGCKLMKGYRIQIVMQSILLEMSPLWVFKSIDGWTVEVPVVFWVSNYGITSRRYAGRILVYLCSLYVWFRSQLQLTMASLILCNNLQHVFRSCEYLLFAAQSAPVWNTSMQFCFQFSIAFRN